MLGTFKKAVFELILAFGIASSFILILAFIILVNLEFNLVQLSPVASLHIALAFEGPSALFNAFIARHVYNHAWVDGFLSR